MPLSPPHLSPVPACEPDELLIAMKATIATFDEALETARVCLAELHMQNLKLARARRAQIAQSNDEIIAILTPSHLRVVHP